MSALVPCTSCQRHVRSSDASCPFCGHDVPTNVAPRAMPTRRLDRLATFTFAVGITVAACGGVPGGEDSTDQQQQGQDDEAELRKRKDAGAPKVDAGCVEEDTGGFHALYGMPPVPVDPPPPCAKDAGAARDAGHADAGHDAGRVRDAGSIHAMYGMPWTPPEDEDGGGFHALYGMPPTP